MGFYQDHVQPSWSIITSVAAAMAWISAAIAKVWNKQNKRIVVLEEEFIVLREQTISEEKIEKLIRHVMNGISCQLDVYQKLTDERLSDIKETLNKIVEIRPRREE